MIGSWEEWTVRQFEELENGDAFWVSREQMRREMTGKFRRIHDRVQRRVERSLTPFAYEVDESRQYMAVMARKHRARKRRKR